MEPSALEAECPSGTVAAAIFVTLMDDVFVARIALGETSCDSDLKIASLIDRFSETAWYIARVTKLF